MSTNFVFFLDLFAGSRRSQDLLGRFSQSLHSVVSIEWQMIYLTFFSDILRDVCHGNQLSGKNGRNYLPPLHLSLFNSETEWDIAL